MTSPHDENEMPGGFLNPPALVPLEEGGSLSEDSSDTPQWQVRTDKMLTARQEQACYMFAVGATHVKIARELSLSQEHVSTLFHDPAIVARVKEIRDKYFGANVAQRYQNMIGPAADFTEKLVKGDVPGAKVSEQWAASQWVLEKTTGKPQQSVTVDAGAGILQLLQALDKATQPREAGACSSSLPDIEVAVDPIDSWVSENVPETTGPGAKK